MFCLNCGKEIKDDATFCIACGQKVGEATTGSGSNSNSNSEMLLDYDIERLIGKKQEYYVPKFKIMKQTGKKTSWNWGAFLFSAMWFVYRKMYLYAVLTFFVAGGLSYISSYLSFAFYIVLGIFGNYIYMNHLEGISKEANTMDASNKEMFILKKGGVNLTAVIVIMVISAVLSIAISFLYASVIIAALSMM